MDTLYQKILKLMLFLFITMFILLVDNYILHILAYSFITFYLLVSMYKTYRTTYKRVYGTLLHLFLLSLQISFSLIYTDWSISNRVIAILLIMPPFLIEYSFFKKHVKLYISEISDNNNLTISFEDLKSYSVEIKAKLKDSATHISKEGIQQMIFDLPRHSSTRYITKGSLSFDYLKHLDESIKDNYVYIVLSDTGSPTSEVISAFTYKTFNHASISFDSDLKTLISYNGGQNLNSPGLNAEILDYLYQKESASIIIYRLKVTTKQKQIMIDKIKQINNEGSAYNIIGLALNKSFKPNIMVCSQFVYSLLKHANSEYFESNNKNIKPTDLVELDYYRKLEFVQTINLSDIIEENLELKV